MDISRTVDSRIQSAFLKFERRVRAAQGGDLSDEGGRRDDRPMRIGDLVREVQDRAGVPRDRTMLRADTVDFKRVIEEASRAGAHAVGNFQAQNEVAPFQRIRASRAYGLFRSTNRLGNSLDLNA